MYRSIGPRRPRRVARLRHLGYLEYGELLRYSLASLLGLAIIFALLPLGPERLARLGIVATVVGWLTLLGLYLSVRETVAVYADEGWYVAANVRDGIVRHGRSVEEALANLSKGTEPDRPEADV